jgi:hypothetical protein
MLRERQRLMLAFAGGGFLWLAILLWLAGSDFVTRLDFPPALGLAATRARKAPRTAGASAPRRAIVPIPSFSRDLTRQVS